jgi:hypothetical protein
VNPADQTSYKRQFDAHAKRLPRGHVIHHATWRNGQLTTMSHKPERLAPDPKPSTAKVRRGAAQEDMFA